MVDTPSRPGQDRQLPPANDHRSTVILRAVSTSYDIPTGANNGAKADDNAGECLAVSAGNGNVTAA